MSGGGPLPDPLVSEAIAARDIIAADNWPLSVEEGSRYATLPELVGMVVRNGQRAEAERDEARRRADRLAARADVAALTQALETAQARIDALTGGEP